MKKFKNLSEEEIIRKELCKEIDKIYKEYTKEERHKIIFSIVGACFGMGGVVSSAILNVQNRSARSIFCLAICAVGTIINGLGLYNGIQDFKAKTKELKNIEIEVHINEESTKDKENNQKDDDKTLWYIAKKIILNLSRGWYYFFIVNFLIEFFVNIYLYPKKQYWQRYKDMLKSWSKEG